MTDDRSMYLPYYIKKYNINVDNYDDYASITKQSILDRFDYLKLKQIRRINSVFGPVYNEDMVQYQITTTGTNAMLYYDLDVLHWKILLENFHRQHRDPYEMFNEYLYEDVIIEEEIKGIFQITINVRLIRNLYITEINNFQDYGFFKANEQKALAYQLNKVYEGEKYTFYQDFITHKSEMVQKRKERRIKNDKNGNYKHFK